MNVKIVVKTIVQNYDSRILVLRRSLTDSYMPGEWDLPGGSVEQDEDPLLAAMRELKEESGIEITELSPIYVCSARHNRFAITIVFKAQYEGEAITISEEHDAYEWLSLEEFNQLDTPEKYKIAIKYI